MKVTLYKPKNPKLREHIEYFYTLSHSAKDGITSYLAFPNTFTVVSALKDARIILNRNYQRVVHCPGNLIESDLVCSFNKPAFIQYEGQSNEVVVLFKPLGINAFLDKNLDFYNDEQAPDFEPFKDYKSALTKIIATRDDALKINQLEDYWLSKLKGFEHPFLFDVVADFSHQDTLRLSITEIASKHNISRATLNKHFKLHICKTPSQFRKIVRFRNAMKRHSAKIPNDQLTDITYRSNYFDQSHMIKDFKALTGYSPKTFFSRIRKIENGELSWLFL